jgi:hypothetical protein
MPKRLSRAKIAVSTESGSENLVPPDKKKDNNSGPAGRVRHDASGRAIWEWAADTGRHALDSTSRLLKRLELPGLALADDEKKMPRQKEEASKASSNSADAPPTFGGEREVDAAVNSRRSFNPYDSRGTVKRKAPDTPPASRVTQPERTRKAGFFARLFGK